MAASKLLQVQPRSSSSRGGDNLRNVGKYSWLAGQFSSLLFMRLPVTGNGGIFGDAGNANGKDEGDLIFGEGATAFSLDVTGTPCSCVVRTRSEALNSELTVDVSGYDQFDNLVTERITVPAAEPGALSKTAFKQYVSVTFIEKGSAASTEFDDIELVATGLQNHNDFSTDTSGEGSVLSCRIGLPFLPKSAKDIKAVTIGYSASSTRFHGSLVNNGDGTWTHDHSLSATYWTGTLSDSDVVNVETGTCLLPAFVNPTYTSSHNDVFACFHLDKDRMRNFH